MKPRDLAIIVAVVLLGTLAALDALRSDGSAPGQDASGTDTAAQTETGPPARESFPAVPTRGSLAFTTGDDCRLRDVSVSAGSEFPLPIIETACQLWAPPVTTRLAYTLRPTGVGDLVPVRFLDPGRPGVDLGTFDTLFGAVVWSQDGQLAAWCDSSTSGFEYEVGQSDLDTGGFAVRQLDFCPRAYTHEGNLAYTVDRELVVEGETPVDVGFHIDQVAWGTDGSIGLVLDARTHHRIERREGSRVTHRSRLTDIVGLPVVFSPDNCAALMVGDGSVRVIDVGCFRGAPLAYEGSAAAWSPDGQWVAIARAEQIVFQRLVGGDDAIVWDADESTRLPAAGRRGAGGARSTGSCRTGPCAGGRRSAASCCAGRSAAPSRSGRRRPSGAGCRR